MWGYDPNRHHRQSIRLSDYDYRSPGAYFVTLVTHGRLCLFGEVGGDAMCRNRWGDIVASCWTAIPRHAAHVTLDEWVVMPNHMHGILILRPPTAIQDGGDDGGGQDGDDGENPGHGRGEASAPSPSEIQSPPSGCFALSTPRNDPRANLRKRSDKTDPDGSSARPIGTQSGSLGAVIQNFKSVTTRRIRQGGVGGAGGEQGGGVVFGGQGEAFADDRDGDPRFLAANASPLQSMRLSRLVWQRGYYEHVVRDEVALDRIRRYIRDNPLRWAIDAENPERRMR